jgi:hypothetical protein
LTASSRYYSCIDGANDPFYNSSHIPYAVNQSIANLALIPLLNLGNIYTGNDGKKYTFGFWNDTPNAGTIMAWQVFIWQGITSTFGGAPTFPNPPVYYFNPGGVPTLAEWQAPGKNFLCAANGMSGNSGVPGNPFTGFNPFQPPGGSFNYQNKSFFSVNSVARSHLGVTANFSATADLNVEGNGYFSTVFTDASQLIIAPVGTKGTFGPMLYSQCAGNQGGPGGGGPNAGQGGFGQGVAVIF